MGDEHERLIQRVAELERAYAQQRVAHELERAKLLEDNQRLAAECAVLRDANQQLALCLDFNVRYYEALFALREQYYDGLVRKFYDIAVHWHAAFKQLRTSSGSARSHV